STTFLTSLFTSSLAIGIPLQHKPLERRADYKAKGKRRKVRVQINLIGQSRYSPFGHCDKPATEACCQQRASRCQKLTRPSPPPSWVQCSHLPSRLRSPHNAIPKGASKPSSPNSGKRPQKGAFRSAASPRSITSRLIRPCFRPTGARACSSRASKNFPAA